MTMSAAHLEVFATHLLNLTDEELDFTAADPIYPDALSAVQDSLMHDDDNGTLSIDEAELLDIINQYIISTK